MAAVWRAEAIKGRSGRHGRGCGAVPGVPPGSSDGPAGVFGRAVCDGSSQVAKAGGGVRQGLLQRVSVAYQFALPGDAGAA